MILPAGRTPNKEASTGDRRRGFPRTNTGELVSTAALLNQEAARQG
jgi:hypothetical protein